MSFLYTAVNVPVPVAPSAPPSQGLCTDTTTTAATFNPIVSGSTPIALQLNQAFAQCAGIAGFGGSGYAVCNGVTLTAPGSGLTLAVSTGVVNIMGLIQYPGGSVIVPDNTSMVYIWMLQNGSVTYTTTTTPPVTNCVYIGNCTTSGGNITVVDYTGVCYAIGGVLLRYTNDRSAPTDTPNVGTSFHTITQAGTYHWNGSVYNSLTPTNAGALNTKITMTGDITAIPQDAFLNFQLDPNGSNRNFTLPNPALLGNAWRISLTHIGSANTITIKDYTGTPITGAVLTTTNRSLAIFTYTNSSGNVAFPGGSWSPGPIPTPTAGAAV
jgi:hypothetical protein